MLSPTVALAPSAQTAQKTILVYKGPGTSRTCVAHTCDALEEAAPHHRVRPIDARTLAAGTWQNTTALLVMPGGRDLPYVRDLKGAANAHIRAFVQGGGSYLGICAGAYYGAAQVEFAQGDPALQVVGERELKFFPGICRGPYTGIFAYHDPKTACAMQVWPQGHFAYYHGGGSFVNADTMADVDVLHWYDRDKHHPATVVCRVGRGQALLTSLHLEIPATSLHGDYPAPMLARLKSCEASRHQTLHQMMQRVLPPS